MERANQQRVHFIAIGGVIMHNLAIALQKKGYRVSGSDDEIYEPSHSRLKEHGLLPDTIGWDTQKITSSLDAVILGMHARADNPELMRAKELGLKVYSYPDYIYEQSKDKQRVVIAGSHGKTTISSIIIHVLKYLDREFDYLVGASVEGFDAMVKLSDAPVIIIEGDEYFTSPLDQTPKFLKYHHHIGLISGIAWDHINVYPTYDDYVKQFDAFADATPKAGTLIYSETDPMAIVICSKERKDVTSVEYKIPKHRIRNGITFLVDSHGLEHPLQVFGKHNLMNISAAYQVLKRMGITIDDFYKAIRSFKGAANRLQLIGNDDTTIVYKDFAHAPSKVEATTIALKEQYPDRNLVTCLELHTFSSLNKKFLNQYGDTMNYSDLPIVYFNPKTIVHKRLEPIAENEIKEAFSLKHLQVFQDKNELEKFLLAQNWNNSNLLMMSSGNFDGLNINELAQKIILNKN
jgi:UDP-N-acetylmuramate: L-alanyl-gamma-D-glutamyl-meso-diaminopimelate ligase